MRLQEIMNTEVKTVKASASVSDAASRLCNEGIHHLVVVDDDGHIVGILSEGDLVRENESRVVADLMSRSIVTASPTTTVRAAANLLRGHAVGCLPVLDGRKLKGMVTVSDLLDLVGRGLERPVARTERKTLRHHRGPRHRPESHVRRD